jgi:Peptidase family S41/PDZ domain
LKKLLLIVVFLSFAPGCFAQLTHEQKVADFKALAGLYDKNYAPYEWKKQVFGFDLLNLEPWLAQVRESRDDLAFYDICVRYVASLHDSHDEFILPSQYEAYLPFTADIYDGKYLIDGTFFDPATYNFTFGDELVSVDGVSVTTWINILQPYSVNGSANAFSRNRLALATILDRYQGWYTYASNIQPGDSANVVIRSQTTGKTASFSIPWNTIFIPLLQEGPVPNPKTHFSDSTKSAALRSHSMKEGAALAKNAWHVWTGVRAASVTARTASKSASITPSTRRLRQFSATHASHVLAGSIDPYNGNFVPLFNPPPGFQLRLGAGAADEFLSGTFPVGNQLIGFIRIPSFEPGSEANAVQQFQNEIAYFQQNTGGLVVDLMSNGGGDGCYANLIAQYLIPTTFQPIRLAVRATENWVEDYETDLYDAENFPEVFGSSQETIDTLSKALLATLQALGQERGLSVPTDGLSPAACFLSGGAQYPPATDASGNNLAYTKPIVVLTNNFTLSAAEFFGATLQDAKRVTVYGEETDGGGGNVVGFNTAPYSEGFARVTLSLGVRNHVISSPNFPSAPLIENIGVVPDVQANFQTRANLFTGGQPFVTGFSNLIHKLITTGHP